MSIKVEWVDPNSGTTDYVIYRQDTPISIESLPAPLATIPSSAREYVDDTVVRNKLYYYVVASRKGADVAYTPNKPIAFMPYTGPGPQTIKRGDWAFGYFGRVPVGEVFSAQELRLGIGYTGGQDANSPVEWLKFVYKGKIVFIASYNVFYSLSWETLYKLGVVYGAAPSSEWSDYPKTTWGIIPQNKILTRYNGDHSFIVRTPTSRANPTSTGAGVDETTGGEFDKILAYAYLNRTYPDTQGYKQVDDLLNGNFSFSSDTVSGALVLIRGNSTSGLVDAVGNIGVVSIGTTTYGWRPLLELIL